MILHDVESLFAGLAGLGGVVLGLTVAALLFRVRLRRSLAHARAAERRARTSERQAEVAGMTRGLAHEIKNPLSTIALNAQLLAEGVEDLPEGRSLDADDKVRLGRRAASLRREVERLRGILTDFLAYAGEMRLDPRPTDINALVDDLAEFYLPQALQQGVQLAVERTPAKAVANADGPLIKQALLNLVLNATQAMSAWSGTKRLTLAIRLDHEKEVGPVTRISIHDTGPGITPDILAKMFTPYFTTKAGGSGLGLVTARRIVEAHGGRIDVRSRPGAGAEFEVTLPMPAAPGGPALHSKPPLGGVNNPAA